MAWDPSVLRKYSTTSHFRLLNQVRSELKSSPLTRNQEGELSVGMGRRGASYRVPVEVRSVAASKPTRATSPQSSTGPLANGVSASADSTGDASSFRDRLRAIEMR